LFIRFVKGLADNAAIASKVLPFSTSAPENGLVTGSLLAQSPQLWPVSNLHISGFLRGRKMTRAFALLFAAVVMLGGAGQAQAQGFFDTRDIMGGGPGFFRPGMPSGASPIPRQTVSFAGGYAPGTIYISTSERRLYLVLGNGQALRYGIGVGRDGFRWGGTHRISAKKEWPSWTPPSQMLRRRPDLPRHMPGGIDNPLGARAMYLGSTLYRIHGSNEPETIGQAVSSGCFRMTNEDVTDLYGRVSVGATVVVKN
jgi:lipoprotein-anchoring transpeptidase ErfK/SrfK